MNKPLSKNELQDLLKRVEGHTEGPWRIATERQQEQSGWWGGAGKDCLILGPETIICGEPEFHLVAATNDDEVPTVPDVANAELIAASPSLLSTVQAQQEEIEQLVSCLRHMGRCFKCAEGDWSGCEQGKKAIALLAKHEGVKP